MAATWFGWAKVNRRWRRLIGPHGSLSEAGASLDAELKRRGLRVPSRNQCLTSGATPPRGPRQRPPGAPGEAGADAPQTEGRGR